jgi:hypothetical protein
MSKTGGEVDWFAEDVILKFAEITEDGLAAVAARVDALAKQGIVTNDQVDTGFMVNSVYHVAGNVSSYQDSSGTHTDKNGNLVDRDMAPEAELPKEYKALVCIGANYAIYQELQKPFLYPALEQVSAEAGGIIEAVAND